MIRLLERLRFPRQNQVVASFIKPHSTRKFLLAFVFDALLYSAMFLMSSTVQAATTLGVTLGSPAITLPRGLVLCNDPGSGWVIESGGTRVRPPTDVTQLGHSITVNAAATVGDCGKAPEAITLIAIGSAPQIDPKSVDIAVDEGRVDITGTNLAGSTLSWDAASGSGSDSCISPTTVGTGQHCAYSIGRKLTADPTGFTLHLYPAGAMNATALFDIQGNPLSTTSFLLSPARIIVSHLWSTGDVADLSAGEAHITLPHQEAVAAVDCDSGRCELTSDGLTIRPAKDSPKGTNVRLQTRPRVFVRSGTSLVTSVIEHVDFVYCPLSLASPGPIRDVDETRIALRLDSHCSNIANSLRWSVNGNSAVLLGQQTSGEDILLMLSLGRISSPKVTIIGYRGSNGTDIVASVNLTTISPPRLNVKLTLDGLGDISFIPTNRSARVSVTTPALKGKLIPLPVDGAYDITSDGSSSQIHGVPGAGGFVTMRFALRDPSLPEPLDQEDLAIFEGALQRELREVNTAAPIGIPIGKRAPIVELICIDKEGRPTTITPGTSPHLPFSSKDSCRLLIHRERIQPSDGEQRLDIDVEVKSSSGSNRSEGQLSQRLVLRHGEEPRIIWLHGVAAQFDHLTVRVNHVLDETQYQHDSSERIELPAAIYGVVFEDTHFRFYATAAIPASLFRFSNDKGDAGNGALTLNLGVLSRLTWVTRDGNDGLFGLEAGVMGMGLATQNTRQLNLVGGVGLSVPLGNAGQPTQAAINIHAWLAYRPGNDTVITTDDNGTPNGTVALSHWSFVFGPSVTFGNVGLDI